MTSVAYRHPAMLVKAVTSLDVLSGDYADIEKTVSTFLDVGDDAGSGMARFVDHVAHLAEIGIEHAIVSPRHPWDEATLDLLVDRISDLHAIQSKVLA